MSVKERIKEYVKSRHMSERAFCLGIGAQGTYIQNMRRSASPVKLERIAQVYPELNLTWLITGQGEMLKTLPTVLEHLVTTEQGSAQCVPEPPYTEEMIKLQTVVIQTQYRQLAVMMREIDMLREQLLSCRDQLNLENGKAVAN